MDEGGTALPTRVYEYGQSAVFKNGNTPMKSFSIYSSRKLQLSLVRANPSAVTCRSSCFYSTHSMKKKREKIHHLRDTRRRQRECGE